MIQGPEYYIDGKPVGRSIEVDDPMELPTFRLESPGEDIVSGLRVWKEIKEKGWLTTDTRGIEALDGQGLMKDAHDERGRVTQKAKMLYRRRFLDKWMENGWVEAVGRGKYALTDYGEVAVEVFSFNES